MPIERVKSGFRDISLSLKRNPLTKDIVVLRDQDAIVRSIKNLIFTSKGEKFFEPEIGSLVNRLLFENITQDLVNDIKRQIEIVIKNNEPRVKIIDVVVKPNYDLNQLNVNIEYLIVGIDSPPQQLSFILLPTR